MSTAFAPGDLVWVTDDEMVRAVARNTKWHVLPLYHVQYMPSMHCR